MHVYTHREKAKNSSLVVNTSIIIAIILPLLFSQAKVPVTCSFSASDGEVSQRFALVNRFPTSKWEEARQFLLGSSQ